MTNGEMNSMTCKMEEYRQLIDKHLHDTLVETDSRYAPLVEAMRYSLNAGGKRIRAILCLLFCEAVGGNFENAIKAACAIEMMHTYSLIHDDLPSMDNDDTRRGMPSNHIKFGEFTAILAGDALQAFAFETLSSSDLPQENIVKMVKVLAQAVGVHGMCGGQYLDLSGEGRQLTVDELLEIYSMKTSALISAATQLGVIAGGGMQKQIDAANAYAQSIGLAFQVRDDVLDRTATAEELGKPIGSDEENKKSTFAFLLGIEECEQMVKEETEKAITAIKGEFGDIKSLIWLAEALVTRMK
jgi:geranylgeranyl diphosphate synthase type II